MNNFTITSQAVKTVYAIQINTTNMVEIMQKLRESHLEQLKTMPAFAGYNLGENVPGRATCQKLLEELWHPLGGRANTDAVRLIVRSLGFDGIENYGTFFSEGQVVKLTAYKNGDCINKF